VVKRYLTLEEARRLLPYIRREVRELVKINRALILFDSVEIEYEDDLKALENDIVMSKRFYKLNYDLFNRLHALLKKGVFVKDLELGLVDIFSRYNGRGIFLCWQYNERDIMYWHEIDAGAAERKSVSLLKRRIL
jgi:hypothetical protein